MQQWQCLFLRYKIKIYYKQPVADVIIKPPAIAKNKQLWQVKISGHKI